MRRGGAGKRRDIAEAPIVRELQAIGAEVWRISGAGLPDLLVRFRGRYFVGEVKSKGGKLTPYQGAFPVWRTPQDAYQAIGITVQEVR